jgi:two-component system, OmpR family, KDP operon response regulator KdpE
MAARGPGVLVIDDDPAIRRLLRQTLTTAGYRVEETTPGHAALRRVVERQFDLVILDIDEPSGPGPAAIGPGPISLLRALSPAPILALSVRDDEAAAANALENGADDYVRKPFGVNELLARAKIVLRRKARHQDKPALFTTGALEIDLLYRRVRLNGQEIHLPVKAYEVLHVLAAAAGKVVTHQQILGAVWGPERRDRADYLRMAIRELRRRLEPNPAQPRYILTEPRVGYRLAPQSGT